MTNNKSSHISWIFAGLLLSSLGQAQESANESGGVARGIGGTLANTIKQAVNTCEIGSTGTLA